MSHGGESRRAIVAALAANLGIAVVKLIAFAITSSSSMLAEGIHSLADTGNQILLLIGGKKAERPADELHPFGHARERYFWAFVVSIVLFTLGSMFAIFEAIEKIIHPEPMESPAWAIATLLVAAVLEGNSFRTVVRESNPLRGSWSWARFVRRSKNPELPVVLLEDSAALVGLLLALVAISLDVITGNPRWDAYGSLAIGILLGGIAIVLAVEMKSLLIGEAADPEEEARIRAAIDDAPSTRHLIFLRTQHLGPDELLVSAKVEFLHTLSMAELAAAIDDVEVDIRAVAPTARYLFIEPDIHRAADRVGTDEPPAEAQATDAPHADAPPVDAQATDAPPAATDHADPDPGDAVGQGQVAADRSPGDPAASGA
jgi:cation diffusion facilitator family transporter